MMDITQRENACSQASGGIRLVVCLGNPGEAYAETRHNAGFQVSGDLLRQTGGGESSSWQPGNGELLRFLVKGRECLLLKPMTYMNSSGESVVKVTRHFGISPSEVLVISDCMDLPFGRLRLRPQGSCGGQNGLRSIIAVLGTEAVPRLRVGIGRPQSSEEDVISHVLSPWTSVEREVLPQILAKASEAALRAVEDGLESAMRVCNSWLADNNNAEKQGVQR